MSSIIRVLHLADIINRYDFIDNVLRYCDRSRFRLYACTFAGASNIQAPVYDDVRRYVLGATGRRSYPRAVATLTGILRRERIDVIHTHHFDPMMIGVTAARITGCTAIVGRHYSNTIHRLANPWKRQAYLRTEAFFHRLAAKIIVPSALTYDLLTRVQGVDAEKVVWIPYGFDFAKYVPSPDGPSRLRRQFAPDDQVLLGCFGRFYREKGQIHLLRAARALLPAYPRLRVLLVGDGPERAMLEAATRDLGLGNHVVFAGWRTDVIDLMAAVDVVIQPAAAGEAFSQVMIEALALGKPLVATDVSGARDVIRDGENGLLVPPRNADAIAAAVGSLLDSPRVARRLGEAGHAYVRRALDIRSIIKQYEECYETVYAERHAA